MRMGMPEMLVVLFIVVVLFGANKIPQLADGLGRGIRNFKKALNDDGEAAGQAKAEPARLAAASTPAAPAPAAHAEVEDR